MSKYAIQVTFYSIVLAGFSLLLFFVIQPYIAALFLATVFAILFDPLQRFLVDRTRLTDGWAALITLIAFLVVFMAPLMIMGATLFQEARDASVQLASNGGVIQYVDGKLNGIEVYISQLAPDLEVSLSAVDFVRGGVSWITENFTGVFTEFVHVTINFFIMLFALFFFLKHGPQLRRLLVTWSPLSDEHDRGLIQKLATAVNSVIKGTLVIAAIQGVLAGVGFTIFGVPSPVLWGFAAMLGALIPSVGTGLVWVPMVLYLYFSGSTVAALGLLLWSAFIVGLIDNILRPIIIERGVNIHPFLIFLSVFGGLSFFGPIGFLYGPILLAFVFALAEMMPAVIRRAHDAAQDSNG